MVGTILPGLRNAQWARNNMNTNRGFDMGTTPEMLDMTMAPGASNLSPVSRADATTMSRYPVGAGVSEWPGQSLGREIGAIDLTGTFLTAIMPRLPLARARMFAPFVGQSFRLYGLDTIGSVSAFFGNTAVESFYWIKVEEDLDYSAKALIISWPSRFPASVAEVYAHHPEMIANRAYANRDGNGSEASGDGWKFRGRGLIQLTGRAQYAEFVRDTGVDAVTDPDLLATPRFAVLSACWYWKKRHLTRIANAGNFETVASIINGVRPPDQWNMRENYRRRAELVLTSGPLLDASMRSARN
ncbi:MAG: glycoside hydrolase family 19 protein [Acidiphilium sp.]